jgi:hypothetical protein
VSRPAFLTARLGPPQRPVLLGDGQAALEPLGDIGGEANLGPEGRR